MKFWAWMATAVRLPDEVDSVVFSAPKVRQNTLASLRTLLPQTGAAEPWRQQAADSHFFSGGASIRFPLLRVPGSCTMNCDAG